MNLQDISSITDLIVTKQQTTFWKLQTDLNNLSIRISFKGKHEFNYTSSNASPLVLLYTHPLLEDYHQCCDHLYISSCVENPSKTINALEQLCSNLFSNWRQLDYYLNVNVKAERILQQGIGLLLHGPRNFVDQAQNLLSTLGIRSTILKGESIPAQEAKLLLLGSNYVIADSFECNSTTI